MASSGDLRSLLGPAIFSQIPQNAQVVLQQCWITNMDTLKSQLEKVKVDAEQRVAELTSNNSDLTSKLAVYTEESERGQSALQMYREQAADNGASVGRLTTEMSQISAERDELKRQLFTAKAERDDIGSLADRRQGEVDRLSGEIRNLADQLAKAQAAKTEALVRMEEVESREVQLDHREKRMTEETEFHANQVKMLEMELEKQREEFLTAKREAGLKMAEMTQDLAFQTEEARNASRSKELLSEESKQFQTHAENLASKLKDARDCERKLEEKFRAELSVQTRLASLYKSHSEEHNSKVEDLQKVVTELQGLLKTETKKYSALEEELGGIKEKHSEELNAQNATITALKKELENANKLIKTFKEKGLSEDSIESLSPSAAHASRLLKSGLTVTGIYSQMVSLGEDLQKKDQEIARLNLYIQQILEEVESRAPQLRKQREEYERLAASVGGLTENLELAREEVELRRSEAGEAQRKLLVIEREKCRLEQQVSDLGKQVTTLVSGKVGSQQSHSRQMDTSSVDSVIENRLLTFAEVSELQQRNIELLAVVRELSAGQEAAEQTRIEEKTAEVKQELDTALRQIEELRTARERQQLMVENLIQQKEMYKSMVNTNGSSGSQGKMVEGEKNKLLQELERVKKDFAEYKEGKQENDKISSSITEKLREDLHEAKIKLAKLSSQEEYHNEKFKIMNSNLESSKKHNNALEDRNKQLHDITAKHEASINVLRRELTDCQNQLSKSELQIDSLEMKNRHLLSTQTRLEAERDVLVKERNSTSRIEANLQQIQLNLQRNEELGKLKLQSDNEKLLKEVELLRTKVESEQEQFRESVKTWEMENKTLREKSETAVASEKNAMEQLTIISNTLDTMKIELKDTTEQLELAESRLAGRGLARQGSSADGQEQGKNRLRDVELLMAQTKQELKSVNNQLNEWKRRADEYKGISEAAEKRMVESSATMQELQSQLETKAKKSEEDKIAAENKVELIEVENRELKSKVNDLESEAGANGGELRDKVRTCLTEIEELKGKLSCSKQLEEESLANANKWMAEARETQEKYEREIVQHARDIEALSRLKQEIKNSSNIKADLDIEKRIFEEQVKTLQSKHESDMSVLKQDKSAVDQQLEVLTAQNENLMSQLERVSKQLGDMTAAGLNTSGTAAADSSINVSINEEDANNNQLMAIIKYLRQEKEILSTRVELMQTESSRIHSQLEHQAQVLAETEANLENERSNQSFAMMSASKHSDLIRKVETLSAVTDSNRMLREEKEKIDQENDALKKIIADNEALKAPMEERLKQSEEKISTLTVDKLALQAEVEKWKKRSDQLVEKSFKINPKELARLQESETQLSKTVSNLEGEKKQFEEKVTSLSKELDSVKTQITTLQEEKKKVAIETQEKLKELFTLKRDNTSAKNIQANLQREVNGHKKKVEELVTKHNADVARLKKEAEENKVGSEEVTNLKRELEEVKASNLSSVAELEEVKKTLEDSKAEVDKLRGTNQQLKKIGQSMRSKFQAEEKKVKELEEEKKKLEEEFKNKSSDPPSEGGSTATAGSNDELEEAHKLLEASQARLEELEGQLDEVKAEKEDLEKKFSEKEKRAKDVLSNARTRIQKVEDEKKKLQEDLDSMTAGASDASSNDEIENQRQKAIASSMQKLRQEKEKLEAEKSEAVAEKEKLMEQVEALQQELVAAQLSAQKPVAVAGVVHQQEKPVSAAVRKQQQPQAHIQPHRHTPRELPQTASIRPMAQRATSQAVVLPSSQVQVSSGQVEVATVQPTVSLSPSVTSASTISSGPQLPSTSQPLMLDPSAPEFVPLVTVASGSSDVIEEAPRAVVTPRQDQPQASTSGPVATSVSSTPTTSGTNPSVPTTASVPPTLKRSRDSVLAESDSISSGEDRAGPSGYQKKARTISSTEFLQVSSGGAEVVEMGGVSNSGEEMESDSSMQVDLGTAAERREVGSSSSINVDHVGTSSNEMAASSGVATSSQEEILDSALDVEDDLSEEIEEEGDAQDLNPDNLEGTTDEDENNGQDGEADDVQSEEDVEVDTPGTGIEDNSSEPSSSTGTRQMSRGLTGSSGVTGYDNDQGESDSVVPTTPKLPIHRRNDGFAEAVSSPQVPSSQDRFVFGSSQSTSGAPDLIVTSSNSGLQGQEGLDRTAVDIQMFARSGAESGQQGVAQEEEEVEESEEGGVSSIVSSSEQQGGPRLARPRQTITWNEGGASGSSSGSTSSSPQRQAITAVK